ncbi:MAG: type I-D CRISPR-associated protein Cas7/Csc2 [Thermoplasmatota archaeon]
MIELPDEIEKVKEKMFVDREEHEPIDNPNKHIKIGILSTTTNPMINRNNSQTGTTSMMYEGEARVVVPAQKWKGIEQSKIVKMARDMDLMPDAYRRNMIEANSGLLNPVSFLFGDTVTTNENGSLRGRINYDWAYSLEPVKDITRRIQHNTLDEDGTIKKNDEGNVASSAIFKTKYVIPDVKFIRFVSLENVTKDMFMMYVLGLLNTHSYGARKTIIGNNMNNEIVAIGYGDVEGDVSSHSVMKKLWKTENKEEIGFKETIRKRMRDAYGEERTITDIDSLLEKVENYNEDISPLKKELEETKSWLEEGLPFEGN